MTRREHRLVWWRSALSGVLTIVLVDGFLRVLAVAVLLSLIFAITDEIAQESRR